MSILSKLSNLKKATNTESARVEMTDLQVEQCKQALRRDNRGYNVQPNRFDMSEPYRVAINYQNKWHNFGNFKSADVAAAIGSIISIAFFADNAVAGEYDPAKVEGNPEFDKWMADPRNAEVIAKANGDVAAGGAPSAEEIPDYAAQAAASVNPF